MWSSRKESIAAGSESRCWRTSGRMSSSEAARSSIVALVLGGWHRQTGENAAEIDEPAADVESCAVDLGLAEFGRMADAAGLHDPDGAFQPAVLEAVDHQIGLRRRHPFAEVGQRCLGALLMEHRAKIDQFDPVSDEVGVEEGASWA